MSAADVETPLSPSFEAATESQTRVRLALGAAMRSGPSHAYLFTGPRGCGKKVVARAFAAELLAASTTDPEETRRRALLDPSPHPDLVWLTPTGSQHLIEQVREQVIRAAAYRPFEGDRRVFVIERAELLRDESQNALLKTLEEPPAFAHLILLSSETETLLETITSRCQRVEFAALPTEAIVKALGGEGTDESLLACARLAAGDLERAKFLCTDAGRAMRVAVEKSVGAALTDAGEGREWHDLLERATTAGEEAEADAAGRLAAEDEAGLKRTARERSEEARRTGRARRTAVLDLGLALVGFWLRDVAATAAGAMELIFNVDRLDALAAQASESSEFGARRGIELVADTRRRLNLNVSEELALEALFHRLRSASA